MDNVQRSPISCNEDAPEPVLRIALVDDDSRFRESLATSLSSRGDVEVVHNCVNGASLLTALRNRKGGKVDVVLIDVDMPGMDGIRVVEALRRDFPEVRPVMLTVFRRNESLQDAMAAGAFGFLTKTETQDEMLQKMRQVSRGESAFSPGPLSIISRDFSERARNREEDQEFVSRCNSLPAHLGEVLNGLIVGENNQAIKQRHEAGQASISNYVSQVVHLTGCASRTEVALRAARCGYQGWRADPGHL